MMYYKQNKPAKHILGKAVGFKKHAIGSSLHLPQLLRSMNREMYDDGDIGHLKHTALEVAGGCARVS